MAKYAIEMEVAGIDMFHLVMKLVEGNPEIKILKSGMILTERKLSGSSRQRGNQNFEKMFFDFLCNDPDRKDFINKVDAELWCEANGYKKTSASAMTSLMVKRGYLQRTGERGHFKVNYPK